MSARDLAEAVDAARRLADSAPAAFAPIRARADRGEIGAVAFHRDMADAIEKQLGKIEHVRARLVRPHSLTTHSRDLAPVSVALADARARIERAGVKA